jgi:polar amino acid transport system substrate-binding protein
MSRLAMLVGLVAAVLIAAGVGAYLIIIQSPGGGGGGSAEKLVLGTCADFPPFESVNITTKKIEGFDIDIAKEIAAKANKTLQIVDMQFDGLISAVKVGSVDLVIAGMTITPARAQQVDFSDPYFGGNQSVVVRSDQTGITKWDDLNRSIKIGVQTDTTGDIWASNHSNIQPLAQIVRYPKFTTAMLELDKGGLDAVIIDSAPAKSYTSSHPSLKIAFEIPTKEKFGIAVKKGDSGLLKLVDDTLAYLRSSGKYDELFKKWFS